MIAPHVFSAVFSQKSSWQLTNVRCPFLSTSFTYVQEV